MMTKKRIGLCVLSMILNGAGCGLPETENETDLQQFRSQSQAVSGLSLVKGQKFGVPRSGATIKVRFLNNSPNVLSNIRITARMSGITFESIMYPVEPNNMGFEINTVFAAGVFNAPGSYDIPIDMAWSANGVLGSSSDVLRVIVC